MPRSDAGHLFVIDGDLTRLHCDALLIPVDSGLNVTPTWSRLLGFVGPASDAIRPADWGRSVRSMRYRSSGNEPEIWLGDIGHHYAEDGWFAAGLVDFVERASETLGRRRPDGCPIRLAVNVAGSGLGGSAHDKGRLFTTIIPALVDAAARCEVDVVLVCWGEQQYAAAQRQRLREVAAGRTSSGLDSRLEVVASQLAAHARRSNLVLFIGAGVSMGAGLHSWQALLDELVQRSTVPQNLRDRLRALDVRDQAELIRKGFESPADFQVQLTNLLTSSRYGLAHGLLASLHTREAVTTNYDDLFEQAATTAGRTCARLPYEPVLEQDSWLLKLHGTLDSLGHDSDLVLTRQDYLGLPARSGALFGVLQAMLMTRHMLFVGYSLTDDSFHKVMHEVRQAMGTRQRQVGTALVLFDDPLLVDLWGEHLDIVAISDRSSDEADDAQFASAARLLDLLLDHIGLLAASVTSFLLDPTYRSMLEPDERQIADLLAKVGDITARSDGPIAELLGQQLERLGAASMERATRRPPRPNER